MKYASDYQTNKVYHSLYKKSKDLVAYFRRHETELILFDGAESMLKRFGINPKNLDLEQLQADYNALLAKKSELQKTYKSAEKKISNLNRKLSNIRQYLGQEQTPEQSTDKKNGTEPMIATKASSIELAFILFFCYQPSPHY